MASCASMRWNTFLPRTGRRSFATSVEPYGPADCCSCPSRYKPTRRRCWIGPTSRRWRAGLPAVPGEDISEDSGGYHFYPSDEQVKGWLSAAGLQIVDDTTDMTYGDWGYRHLLLEHEDPRRQAGVSDASGGGA